MPENQRKNRRARGRNRRNDRRFAPTQVPPDIVTFERKLHRPEQAPDEELPSPAMVDDRSGRPGPPPEPGVKVKHPQRRG